MAEKRRHPRRHAHLDVFYYTEVSDSGETRRVYYPGTIIDTSQGGLGVLTGHPHRLQEQLWFEALGKDKQAVAGEVRWIEGSDSKYHLGVELSA